MCVKEEEVCVEGEVCGGRCVSVQCVGEGVCDVVCVFGRECGGRCVDVMCGEK